MQVYTATAEDLTHLGGPMGSEYTTERNLGLFSSADSAKAACAEHYKKPLAWIKEGCGWRTHDLRYVMYHIYIEEAH